MAPYVLPPPSAALLRLASLRSGLSLDSPATDKSSNVMPSRYDPSEVFALAQGVLTKYSSAIQSDLERYAIHEQLFLASLDTSNLAEAKRQLSILTEKFPPTSTRLLKLSTLLTEAQSDPLNPSTTLEAYKKAMQVEEHQPALRKRYVSLLWTSGKHAEAIAALVEYLDTYAQDTEAWAQLASYYASENMYAQSAFCVEEMMIMKPGDHLLQIRYAELLKTMGKEAVALRYYCAALEGVRDHVRCLYGIRLIAGGLIKKGGVGKLGNASGGEDAEAELPSMETLKALHKLAGDRLEALYKESAETGEKGVGAELLTVVKAWLQASAA
ncbi:hypothetical protein HDV05_000022 [Chytridiales sp. JEL 0842]|nr:hypothetical protein HDV05_000022 [Chytridiales sp. JEL 0842]